MTSAPVHAPRDLRHPRPDRPVLVANLLSGALWLAFPVAIGSWPLGLVGAAYVLPASLFLAAVYSRATLTRTREAIAWTVPWLLAVALWAVVVGAVEPETSAGHVLGSLAVGAVLGSLAYLGWQAVALAIRQLLAWRAAGSTAAVDQWCS